MEYMSAEILELAGNANRDRRRNSTPDCSDSSDAESSSEEDETNCDDIMLAISNDEELAAVFMNHSTITTSSSQAPPATSSVPEAPETRPTTARRCPDGCEELKVFTTPLASFMCDICETSQAKGARMYGARCPCNDGQGYDECESCFTHPPVVGAVIQIPGHGPATFKECVTSGRWRGRGRIEYTDGSVFHLPMVDVCRHFAALGDNHPDRRSGTTTSAVAAAVSNGVLPSGPEPPALRHLRLACGLAPSVPEYHAALGEGLLRFGSISDARIAFKAASQYLTKASSPIALDERLRRGGQGCVLAEVLFRRVIAYVTQGKTEFAQVAAAELAVVCPDAKNPTGQDPPPPIDMCAPAPVSICAADPLRAIFDADATIQLPPPATASSSASSSELPTGVSGASAAAKQTSDADTVVVPRDTVTTWVAGQASGLSLPHRISQAKILLEQVALLQLAPIESTAEDPFEKVLQARGKALEAIVATVRLEGIALSSTSSDDVKNKSDTAVDDKGVDTLQSVPQTKLLLYALDSNLAIASAFQATHRSLVLRVLKSTRELLTSLDGVASAASAAPTTDSASAKKLCTTATISAAVARVREFLSEVIADSDDDDVIAEAVVCVTSLAKLHLGLRERIEVLQQLRTSSKLPASVRSQAHTEITEVLTAAYRWSTTAELSCVRAPLALVDGTPECCRLLAGLLREVCTAITEYSSNDDIEIFGRRIHATVSLLRLSLEACSTKTVTELDGTSLLSITREAFDVCTTRISHSDELHREFVLLLRVIVAVTSPVPLAGADLFFSMVGDKSESAKQTRLAALHLVKSSAISQTVIQAPEPGPSTDDEPSSTHSTAGAHTWAAITSGRVTARVLALLEAGLDCPDSELAGAARKALSLYQTALLASSVKIEPGEKVEPFTAGIEYTATLFAACAAKIHTVLQSTGATAEGLELLRGTIGELVPTWLCAAYVRRIMVSPKPAIELLTALQQLGESVVKIRGFDDKGVVMQEVYSGKAENWIADLTRTALCYVQLGSRESIRKFNEVLEETQEDDTIGRDKSTSEDEPPYTSNTPRPSTPADAVAEAEAMTPATAKLVAEAVAPSKEAEPFVQRGFFDKSRSSAGGVFLHELCYEILAASGVGGELLTRLTASCAPVDGSTANLVRGLFASLVWHCPRLGDAALAYRVQPNPRSLSGPATLDTSSSMLSSASGSPAIRSMSGPVFFGATDAAPISPTRPSRTNTGDSAFGFEDDDNDSTDGLTTAFDMLSSAYQTANHAVSAWISAHAVDHDGDPLPGDRISSPLARATLVLEVNSKYHRADPIVSLAQGGSDTLPPRSGSDRPRKRRTGSTDSAGGIQAPPSSRWRKVQVLGRAVVRFGQGVDPTSSEDGKAVLAFVLPSGDSDGDDAAALRAYIAVTDRRSSKIRAALEAIMTPLDALPKLARQKYRSQVRATFCKQRFPHPLRKVIGSEAKLAVCDKFHTLLLQLTEEKSVLFGATTQWQPADAAFLVKISMVQTLLNAALAPCSSLPITSSMPANEAWPLLRALAMLAFSFDDTHFELESAELRRQLVRALLEALAQDKGPIGGSLAATTRTTSLKESGLALIGVLELCVPHQANADMLEPELRVPVVEILLSLILDSSTPTQVASQAFSLFVRVLEFVGPADADAAVLSSRVGFLHNKSSDTAEVGSSVVSLLCALVGTGAWTLPPVDVRMEGSNAEHPAANGIPKSAITAAASGGGAVEALVRLRNTGFDDAIAAFLETALHDTTAGIPTSSALHGSVLNANIALAILGGHVSVLRPGAKVLLGDEQTEVQVLAVDKVEATAVVSRTPGNSRWSPEEVSVDTVTLPPPGNVDCDALPLLLPYVRWHTAVLLSEIPIENANLQACSEQSCLALRAMQTMLVQHPSSAAISLAADSDASVGLSKLALQVGTEPVPPMPISVIVAQLEEVVMLLADGVTTNLGEADEKLLQILRAKSADAESEVQYEPPKKEDYGLKPAELEELTQVSVNFGIEMATVVSAYVSAGKNYEATMKALLEGDGALPLPCDPSAPVAPRAPEPSPAVVKPSGSKTKPSKSVFSVKQAIPRNEWYGGDGCREWDIDGKTGLGEASCRNGATVFASHDSVIAGAPGRIAWRIHISGNSSFSVGAIASDQLDSATQRLHEDRNDPLVVNSRGTGGGNERRLAMMNGSNEVVLGLDGAACTLTVWTVERGSGAGSGPGDKLVLQFPDHLAATGSRVHLACNGFSGTCFSFRPLGTVDDGWSEGSISQSEGSPTAPLAWISAGYDKYLFDVESLLAQHWARTHHVTADNYAGSGDHQRAIESYGRAWTLYVRAGATDGNFVGHAHGTVLACCDAAAAQCRAARHELRESWNPNALFGNLRGKQDEAAELATETNIR